MQTMTPTSAETKMTASRPICHYALGNTDAEHQRLIRQAAYLAPITEQLFREAGIGRGSESSTSAPAPETWPCWRPGWLVLRVKS